MARVLILDSRGTADNGGEAVTTTLAQDEWLTTRPMRAHGGPKGDQRNISYEFILSGDPVGASLDFEWYQEFFNDYPWVNVGSALPEGFRQLANTPLASYPQQRVFPGSAPGYPWAREQVAIAGAIGAIDHYNVTRNVAGMATAIEPEADCRYFPMLVHTLWVRLKVRTTTAEPVGGYPQFRIYAHGGGLTDVESFTERIDTVFNWTVSFPE